MEEMLVYGLSKVSKIRCATTVFDPYWQATNWWD
jgi:hypothetical protein